jgi:hypothetical protein
VTPEPAEGRGRKRRGLAKPERSGFTAFARIRGMAPTCRALPFRTPGKSSPWGLWMTGALIPGGKRRLGSNTPRPIPTSRRRDDAFRSDDQYRLS